MRRARQPAPPRLSGHDQRSSSGAALPRRPRPPTRSSSGPPISAAAGIPPGASSAARSWDALVQASLTADRKDSITLQRKRATEMAVLSPNQEMSAGAELTNEQRAWRDAINAALEKVAQPEVTIYIQGLRDDFDGSVAVAAELRHFLGRRQVVVAYSWPCRQRLLNYSGDVDRAKDSGPQLAALIEFLATHTRAQHINIIGYSAGATLTVEGIVKLRERHAEMDETQLREKFRVGNIILVGADVDLKTFVKSQLLAVTAVVTNIQVTMSRNDQALSWSKTLHRSSRLGRPDIGELTPAEVEEVARQTKLHAVDVSAVKGAHAEGHGLAGHGYWYTNPWISSDVLMNLIWQFTPDQRGLVRVPGRQAWTFPEDYVDRIHRVVSEQRELLRQKKAGATDR